MYCWVPVLLCCCFMLCLNLVCKIEYRNSRNIGNDLNLMIWWILARSPEFLQNNIMPKYSGEVMDVWVDVEACMKFALYSILFQPDRVLITEVHNFTGWNVPLMRKHEVDILCGSDMPNNFATFLNMGRLPFILCKKIFPSNRHSSHLKIWIIMKSTFYYK